MMKLTYKHTLRACFIAYFFSSVINNYVPLLFVTFQESYAIPLEKITLLITANFVVQFCTDTAMALFADKINQRAAVVLAHVFGGSGLVLLTVLPNIFSNSFVGLLISVVIYAIGSGMLEVLISPITEACPSENKEKAMSVLHSFYCWGCVIVVIVSTLFFSLFGTENWRLLTLMWAIVPTLNIVLFSRVPLYSLTAEGEKWLGIKDLFKNKIFWMMLVIMVCSGASEQTVAQWASVFAEQGLNVSKTVGDLAGPMAFSVMMGISRSIYGKYGERINLDKFIKFSSILCIVSFVCIFIIPNALISLICCAITGFATGIMWPGTICRATAVIKGAGPSMFAFLALAGDLGCSSGPTVAGLVSAKFDNNLKAGILAAVIFPTLLLIFSFISAKAKSNNK